MTKDRFLNNLARCLRLGSPGDEQEFANRMQRFYVEDLAADENVSVILVCESPHTDEINQCYPLAGKSGEDVTATLARLVFGRSEAWGESMPDPWNQPIGRLVKNRHPCFRWLGIMNVCPIPLQKDAYEKSTHKTRCPERLSDRIERIKKSDDLTQRRRNIIARCVQSVILRSFGYRIGSARRKFPNATLIPCGKFAETAFTAIGDNVDICGIPHPSRGQWVDSLRWAGNIKEMSKEISRRTEIVYVRSRP